MILKNRTFDNEKYVLKGVYSTLEETMKKAFYFSEPRIKHLTVNYALYVKENNR